MNEVMIFSNENFGSVRTIWINDKPYFCGADVAKALGYVKPRNAIEIHCKGGPETSSESSNRQKM